MYSQLRNVKRGTRKSASDTVTYALTRTMSDAQVCAIARCVSAQPWPKLQDKITPSSDPIYRRGAEIVAYGDCGACHFNNWQGYSANPRLRGQTPAYLTTTLNEFRDATGSPRRAITSGAADDVVSASTARARRYSRQARAPRSVSTSAYESPRAESVVGPPDWRRP